MSYIRQPDLHHSSMGSSADSCHISLIRDFPEALETGAFILFYQPIANIPAGRLHRLEALVHWHHPEFGLLGPEWILPAAEELGLQVQLDGWVLNEILMHDTPCPVHVNLFPKTLLEADSRNSVLKILRSHPDRIFLELAETLHADLPAEIVDDLLSAAIPLVIDRFGSGYSSMARMTALPFSSLKIAPEFVKNVSENILDAAICTGILRLAKGLNIDVIADGVATPAQARFLFRNGCRYMQGSWISPPVPLEAAVSVSCVPFRMTPPDKYAHALPSPLATLDVQTAMMVELNDDGRFLRVPNSFCRYCGYDAAKLYQKSLCDLIPPAHFNSCAESLAQLKKYGRIENAVFYLQCADGTKKCTAVSGLRGSQGDSSTYLYFEDNSDFEEKMMDLHGMQYAYNILFFESPLAEVVWRHDFEILDWNLEAASTFGWQRDEAIGRNLIKLLVRPGLFPDSMRIVKELETNELVESVNYNVTKTGQVIICRWVNRAIRDSEGQIRFYISSAKDITQDLLKNDRIKQLSSAVEKSGAAVVVTDDAGQILSVNQKFCQLAGYDESELVGKSISLISSHELPREVYEGLWNTLRSGGAWEGEFLNRRKDGGRYWSKTTVVPVVSDFERSVRYLGILRDLTEEKEQEEKTTALYRLLSDQDKLATLGAMLGGISHETFNHMAYVESNLAYAEKLAVRLHSGKVIDQADLVNSLSDARQGLDHMKDLLMTLKNISRKEDHLRLETCDLKEEILLILNLMKSEYKYHATVVCSFGENLMHTGYPGLLRQVVMNVLINAIYAVKAKRRDSLGTIGISIEKAEDAFFVRISDDGAGMDEQTLSHIFEPFFTTKKSGEGTGLGLSISRDIMEKRYEGSIHCQSTLGSGTCFTLSIPDKKTHPLSDNMQKEVEEHR